MTMMMFTALAVTREIERGTMESLLSMPIKPVEIMIGKIAPFVLVGFVQMTIILVAAYFVFDVPIHEPGAKLAAVAQSTPDHLVIQVPPGSGWTRSAKFVSDWGNFCIVDSPTARWCKRQ
jgi:ABC-type Na+ efflux pump permease subunit